MNAQFARAHDAWSNAALHARNAGDRRDELESLSWVPLTLWAGPTPADEGIRGCREVLDRARGDTKATSSALFCQAAFEAGLGRFDEARALFARAGGMLDDLGLAVWRAGPFAQFRGWAELLAGDPAAAERELAAAADTLRQIGEVSWLSSVLGILAEAVDLQGRHDDAEHLVQASLEAAAEDDVYARVLAQCVRAKVLARRGQADEAVRLALAAVGLARAIDFLHLRWHALLCEADVLALAGRAAEALPAIEEAIGVAEAKGNVVGARLARRRLEHPAAEGSPASRRRL
jgi:hypothetical protein